MPTVEARRAWQRRQLSRLEGILEFLDTVANDDALLTDVNPINQTHVTTIAKALLGLGLSDHDLKRFTTVGEVRAFISPFRDYVSKHLEYLSKMDGLDSIDRIAW